MIRRQLALGTALAALLLAALPAAAQAPATPPLLRDQTVVADGAVRLGDLFANLADGADRIVAAAPGPGTRIVFDAEQLVSIAAAHGVAWEPRGRFDRVAVERESRALDAREIERRVADAIAAEAGRFEFEVEADNRQLTVYLPVGAEDAITIENLRVDARGRRVTATLMAPDGDGGTMRVPVGGRLHPVLDVPVLRAPIMPGQAITEADLEWASLRADRVRRDVVTDARWMIGMTPRRALTPGAPIAMRDLQERIVVARNSTVTIVLRAGAMTLTARGRALDAGAQGAAIRVVNPRSERVVEATVIAPDTVEIRPMHLAPTHAPAAHQQAALHNGTFQAGSFR
ncbi:MAG: flagellar basal body P-ring formation chaperone FlgA [Alphaproteobacteria bacterium]